MAEAKRFIIARDVKFQEENTTGSTDARGDMTLIDDDIEMKEDSQIEIITNVKNTSSSKLPNQTTSSHNTPVSRYSPNIIKENRRARGQPRIIRTGSRGRPRRLFSSRRERDQETQEDPTIQGEDEEGDDEVFAGVAEVAVKEAMKSPKNEEWKRAIQSEVENLVKNDTWEIVEKPKG